MNGLVDVGSSCIGATLPPKRLSSRLEDREGGNFRMSRRERRTPGKTGQTGRRRGRVFDIKIGEEEGGGVEGED